MDRSAQIIQKRALPSIRNRLTIIVLTCIVPALIGFVLLLGHFYDRERAQLKRDTIATARAMMLAVDRDLNSAKMSALALASSPTIDKHDFAAFYAQSKSVLTNEFPGDLLVLSDRTAQEIVNTSIPFGQPLPHDGAPEQVRKVFETGKPVVSDLFTGGVLRRPVLAVHVPVWRDGKVAYALAVGFLPARINQILDEQRLPPDRVVAVLDSKGVIVARVPDADKFVGKKTVPALIERLQMTNEDEIEVNTQEGIPVFADFSRSAISGWSVAIGVPTSTVRTELLKSVAWITAIVVVLLAVGLFLAWSFGNAISRAVKALSSNTQQPISNEALTFSEASEVASELMRNRLQLEKLLAERTAERDLLEKRVLERTEEIRHLVFFDSLTGLPNRRMLRERLDKALETSLLTGCKGALMFLDMDNFKTLNDTLGHSVGDLLLQAVSQRLLECVGKENLVVRLGGDEFVVLLENLSADTQTAVPQADNIGQKILVSLNQLYDLDGHSHHSTSSIGMTIFDDSGDSIEQLLKQADVAMYQAKTAGRNTLRFFDPKLQDIAVAHRLI